MRTIHIGHHFFGAGNAGDDWMIAGFLSALPPDLEVRLTCCIPYPGAPLQRRFPRVQWLPYDAGTRQRSIEECSVWLGLGGSPFQSDISRWFVDHLTEEARFCAAADKPMYFLGVGGQDSAAYVLPEIQRVLAQAEKIWTRDVGTAEAVANAGGRGRVAAAADLAHLLFQRAAVPAAAAGRLTAVLNFDYAAVPDQLGALLAATRSLGPREKIWAVQEQRVLPGAELWLFDQLTPEQSAGWQVRQETLDRWPSGEWLLSSRYHSTLAGAWAGSRAVVIALNDKLRGAAAETGFPLFELERDPADRLEGMFREARPVARNKLAARAELAARACADFFRLV